MNRRNFLRSLAIGAAAGAAVRTWPFRSFFIPPAPRIVAGDIVRAITLSTDYGFEPGQMVAIYSASGGLCRGAFRIVEVGKDPNTWRVEYVEKMPARDFLWDPNASATEVSVTRENPYIPKEYLDGLPLTAWRRKLTRA